MVSKNSLPSECVTLISPVVNLLQKGDKLAAFSLGKALATNLEGSGPPRKATSRDFTRLIIVGRLADKESAFRAPLPV